MEHQALVLSRGIKSLDNLELFLKPKISLTYSKGGNFNSVCGWGHKATSTKARAYAKDNDLPYIAIEDGFLRSVGLGVHGATPHSLVIDYNGIYYDSRQESDLESMVSNAQLSNEQTAFASLCINAIREHRLSKYNLLNSLSSTESYNVLVIDQTVGDASVEGAQADHSSFIKMLKEALDNHPEDTIWVKVHPDVACGKKKGYLYPLPIEDDRIKVVADSKNPWEFLDTAEHVYTVSSLMGFEALLGVPKFIVLVSLFILAGG